MASVHKDPLGRSKYWRCCFRTFDGKRRMVSTKETDQHKAMLICQRWQEAENLAAAGNATEEQIKEIFNETLRRVGLREITVIRMNAWAQDFLSSKRNIGKSTVDSYEQVTREFLQFLGRRRNAPIDSVTEKDIDGFLNHLSRSGRSNATINKLRRRLSSIFEKAHKLGKIPYNPVAVTEPLPNDSGTKAVFSAEDVVRLIEAAPNADWKGAITLAYCTGLRLQDCCSFQWSGIDTENGVLTLKQGKTKKNTVLGIHADFADWLTEQPIRNETYLFPSLANRAGNGRDGLSASFSVIMDRAGIVNPILKKRSGKGRQTRALSFHSFRHSAASSVFNSAGLREIQARVTGHSRKGVLAAYTHHDLNLIKEAVQLIPRLPK
jgi:integrase